jgi:hypothetical protein
MSVTFPSPSTVLSSAKKAIGIGGDAKPAESAAPKTRSHIGDSFERDSISDWFQKTQPKITKALNEKAPETWAEAGKQAQTKDQAQLVAQNAALSADVIAKGGDVENAGRTLSQTADALMKKGHFDEAEGLLKKLKEDPYKDAGVNISKGTDALDDYGKTKITCNKSKFDTKFGDVADLQKKQLDQLKDMKAKTGKVCDPHNMADAKLYFQKLSDQNPGKDGAKVVAEKFNEYQKNFFVHPGGVKWDSNVPINERPGRMNELLSSTHSDNAGRKMIDCEGYMYLTNSVFKDITGPNGKPRFEVMNGGDGNHVISSIHDRSAKAAYLFNNDEMKNISGESALRGPRRAMEAYGPFVGANAQDAYDPKKLKDLD